MKYVKKFLSLALISMLVFNSIPYVSANGKTSERMDAVIQYAEHILENGRNIDGSAYPSLFVDGINIDTRNPVEWKNDGKTYYPSNFFNQQNFLRTLVGISNLTGDNKYKNIAEEQVKLWFDEFTDSNGLVYAGAHSFVDVKTGQVLTTGDHEMKDETPYYEFMYEVAPEVTEKYMEAFWNAHITDWSSLAMNRHGTYNKPISAMWDSTYTDDNININNGTGVAFQSTGNDLIDFAFFISEKTENENPEIWAKRLLQKYMDTANPDTGLSGAQYGELEEGDRAQKQFGTEFGEIAKEYNYVDRYAIGITAGYTPMVLLPYYEQTHDEEVLNYVVNTIEGVAEHAYDAETNTLRTPMWSDGTDLRGYEMRRNGYYGNAGKKFPTSETITGPLLRSAVYAHKISGSEIIWQFARDLAKGYGLGDIGSALGADVNLNMNATTKSSDAVFALLDLYDATEEEKYLSLAEKLGDNMLGTLSNNMFVANSDRINAKIGNGTAVVLLCIEAAVQGKYDAVSSTVTNSGIDFYYDGMGRATESAAIYGKNRVTAETVSIDEENITITMDSSNLKTLNCTIAPNEAKDRIINWSSDNEAVVKVDENGVLHPVSIGTAYVTAECDGKTDTCAVNVVAVESWMLKSISVNGQPIDGFSPVTCEYRVSLPVGVYEIPEISGISVLGKEVAVILPRVIPGIARVYVEGEDNAYILRLFPEHIDYTLNEGFDFFDIGTVPYGISSQNVIWHSNSTGWINGADPFTVQYYPETENPCIRIPYNGNLTQFSARFIENPYNTGSNAEAGMCIVVEYDLMTTAAFPGLKVQLGNREAETGSTQWAIQYNYDESSIVNHKTKKVLDNYQPNAPHNVKLIINKNDLTSDAFSDGSKMLTEQAPLNSVSQINVLTFQATAGLGVNAMVYIDNIKIYEVPSNIEVSPFFTNSENEAITYINSESEIMINPHLINTDDGVETNADVIYAIYTSNGNLKYAHFNDLEIENALPVPVDIGDMQEGDYLCVYIWTKDMKPLLKQKYIYKC